MDIEITTTTGTEGTADTGATGADTRTGEQMLMDAFADNGSANSGDAAAPADADEDDAHDPDGGDDAGTDTDDGDVPAGTQKRMPSMREQDGRRKQNYSATDRRLKRKSHRRSRTA